MKSSTSMEICSVASGSSGNCYIIKSENATILVDVGVSGKKIIEGIQSVGREKEDISGVLLTHGHSDHTKGLRIISKRIPEATIYSTAGTWVSLDDFKDEKRTVIIDKNQHFKINDIEIKAFPVSHDMEETVGYSFFNGEKQISIVTDTGCIDDEIFDNIKDADVLVIEANHEIEILEVGNYPYFLKRRILSDEGHLSNTACGECVSKILKYNRKERTILLAHLSRENNTPHHARLTICNFIEEAGLTVGEKINLEVLERNAPSILY